MKLGSLALAGAIAEYGKSNSVGQFGALIC